MKDRTIKTLGCLLMLLSAVVVCSMITWAVYGQTLPSTQATTQPTVPYFAVYSQPMEDLEKWDALGFNSFLMSELKNRTVNQKVYRAKAASLGWKYFDTYLSDEDVLDPNLLGWVPNHSDEWNRRKPDLSPIITEIGYLQELNARTGSTKIILVNGDGPAITTAMWEKVPYNGVKNGERSIYPLANGWSLDWYPVVGTASNTPEQIARRPMYLPTQALWVLHERWNKDWQATVTFRSVILEANKNWNSPLAVSPAQIWEQAEYVLGVRPFPVPNKLAQPILYQGQLATDMVVYWFQNGQNGPGWRWDTSTAEQKEAVAGVIRRYKRQSAPGPLPDSPELAEARRRILDLTTQLKASEAQKTLIIEEAQKFVNSILATTRPTTQPTP